MTPPPPVVGAADVDAAAPGPLRVGPRAVVTPLARERARELGVEIVVAATPTPASSASHQAEFADSRATPTPASSASHQAVFAVSPAPPPSARTTASAPRTSQPGGSPRSRPDGREVTRNAARSARPPGATDPRPVAATAAPRLEEPGPPSGALYRRGAPVAAPRPSGRVVVVGAGHVGMAAALRLAEADVFTEVVLVDIDSGRAAGIALDLVHVAGLGGFATAVRGVGSVEEAGRADHVIITAGRPRQPGMSRSDLIETNAEIVGDVARRVAATSPDAVLLVVTNPLDEMTQHAWRASGFPPQRVLGMAGVLDTARFQALVGLTGVAR
ncbi:MAG: hypothetical protein AB7J32_25375, partial [Pseudonocardia sp.]